MTPDKKLKFKTQAQARAMFLAPAVEDAAKRYDVAQYVEGYAASFEPYLLYDDPNGRVYERFERSCFENCDTTDVILQYDHAGRVFARTTNNTLIVEVDDRGLFIAADLSRTELARGLHEDITAGMITKMSWRFRPEKWRVERIAGTNDVTIVHERVKKIYDVSAVSIPANNDGTEINARSWCDGVIAELARSEALEAEQRQKIKLRILINGGTIT